VKVGNRQAPHAAKQKPHPPKVGFLRSVRVIRIRQKSLIRTRTVVFFEKKECFQARKKYLNSRSPTTFNK
ncbi:hypothetical protein, partial [Caballeronia arationis]|uniref:hypothetical protein n=1 Tax=Caballeronia arationis TaxID=1777142 RepID=UPI001F1E9091